MLTIDPEERTSNVASLSAQPYLSDMNMDAVLKRQINPEFIPPVSCVVWYSFENWKHHFTGLCAERSS